MGIKCSKTTLQIIVVNLARKMSHKDIVKKLKKEDHPKFFRKPIPENNAGSPSSSLRRLYAGVYVIASHFSDLLFVAHEKNSFISGSIIRC